MKVHRLLSTLPGIFLFLGLATLHSPLFAVEENISVFQGLKKIYVQLAPLDQETEQKGLDASRLLKDTKQQLRKAGVEMLSETEFARLRRSVSYPLGLLDISVDIDEAKLEHASLNINNVVVRVRQPAYLGRKPSVSFFATTWERREINYSNSLEDVHHTLNAIVTEFIGAYSAANAR